MAPKTAKVYTVEELKAKCHEALSDSNLVVIAGLTPNKAYDRAFEYACNTIKDLQTAKKLAVATRFLAILRRDHREEFEKLIAREELPKPQSTKTIYDFQFDLPPDAELITREMAGVSKKVAIRFTHEYYLIIFLREILAALRKVELPSNVPLSCEIQNLQSEIIQLLEEKFGLKVKVCGNCRYLGETPYPQTPGVLAENSLGNPWPCYAPPNRGSTDKFKTCEKWFPK